MHILLQRIINVIINVIVNNINSSVDKHTELVVVLSFFFVKHDLQNLPNLFWVTVLKTSEFF